MKEKYIKRKILQLGFFLTDHRGGGFDPGYESVPDKRGQGSEPGYETVPGNEAIHMFRDPGYETLVQNKPDPGYATVVEPRKVVEHGYENLVQPEHKGNERSRMQGWLNRKGRAAHLHNAPKWT